MVQGWEGVVQVTQPVPPCAQGCYPSALQGCACPRLMSLQAQQSPAPLPALLGTPSAEVQKRLRSLQCPSRTHACPVLFCLGPT